MLALQWMMETLFQKQQTWKEKIDTEEMGKCCSLGLNLWSFFTFSSYPLIIDRPVSVGRSVVAGNIAYILHHSITFGECGSPYFMVRTPKGEVKEGKTKAALLWRCHLHAHDYSWWIRQEADEEDFLCSIHPQRPTKVVRSFGHTTERALHWGR